MDINFAGEVTSFPFAGAESIEVGCFRTPANDKQHIAAKAAAATIMMMVKLSFDPRRMPIVEDKKNLKSQKSKFPKKQVNMSAV
jgi:hypothetical protein